MGKVSLKIDRAALELAAILATDRLWERHGPAFTFRLAGLSRIHDARDFALMRNRQRSLQAWYFREVFTDDIRRLEWVSAEWSQLIWPHLW